MNPEDGELEGWSNEFTETERESRRTRHKHAVQSALPSAASAPLLIYAVWCTPRGQRSREGPAFWMVANAWNGTKWMRGQGRFGCLWVLKNRRPLGS